MIVRNGSVSIDKDGNITFKDFTFNSEPSIYKYDIAKLEAIDYAIYILSEAKNKILEIKA